MSSSVLEPATSTHASEAQAASQLPLANFVLDLAVGELLTSDHQVAGLRKQALEVLLVLGRRAGLVVTKGELMRTVWPDVVVGEGSLAQAVSDIRHVLRDDDHRLLRSVARRGYMLVPDAGAAAPIAVAEASQAAYLPESAPTTANGTSASAHTRTPTWLRKPSAAVAALSIGVVVAAGALVALLQAELQSSPSATTKPSLSPKVPSVSLVVLPLKSAGGGAEDWFADAITTDLTTSMSRMSGTLVIGRDTAFTYKGKQTDPRDVARELGVRYVVVGSTRRDGDHVRLNLSMVDGESGVQQWGQQFVVERAELERSIDDIVGQLARSLFVELFHSVGDRATRLKPAEIAADDLAMRGWSVYQRGLSAENVREGLRLFEQALEKDPNSVRALAGVSVLSNFGAITGWLPDKVAPLRRAEEATARLEQLGGDDWFTLIARSIQLNVRGDRENMLRVADTLVARFPNDPAAYHQRSTALLYLGRFEESILPAQRAIRISPHDTRLGIWYWHVANSQFMLGQYDAATGSARHMQAASPNLPLATPLLAASLVRSGHKAEAEKLLRDYLATNPNVDASSISARMRSEHPRFVEGRDRMIASLREIGLH